jgi:hypothetical protein
MKKSLYAISFLACIACNEATKPTTNHTHDDTQLAAAAKLLGSWQNTSAKGMIAETWEQQNDSVYSGKSYVVMGTDTLSSETILLQQTGNEVWYIPTVKEQNGAKPIPFRLTVATATQLVFENPKHDFPQKIAYTFIGNDSLVAEISGDAQGRKQPQLFPMKRVQ